MKVFAYLAECYELSGAAAYFLMRWAVVFGMLTGRVYAFCAILRLGYLAALELRQWVKGHLRSKDKHGPVAPMPTRVPDDHQDGPSA